MTFYRLILLIDIFICLVVTAVCLFFIKVLHHDAERFLSTTLKFLVRLLGKGK